MNGGEPIADMEYTSKSESVILPTLKRAHYTFGGWYEDSAFTQKVESISVNAGKDYELHAQWIPVTYTVSFYANGGTTVSDQTVAYNSKAVKPSDPVQEGYTFGGWYLDVACTQAYDFDTEITDDVCLYAKWTENVPTENDSGCAGTISILPICGLLVAALGCVLVKRKSKE